ncbi:hypothetical protein JCM12298_08810 [Desulfothermus naphthae]
MSLSLNKNPKKHKITPENIAIIIERLAYLFALISLFAPIDWLIVETAPFAKEIATIKRKNKI